MSESQGTQRGLQFFLSRKRLPEEDEYPHRWVDRITETIDLHIDDFLERLNEADQHQRVDEDFIKSPIFLIGGQRVFVGIYVGENNGVFVRATPLMVLTTTSKTQLCSSK